MRFHWLLPSVKGIPVLMYHRVWPCLNDGLTVTPEKLREQWTYLRDEGYKPLSLGDFLKVAKGTMPRPEKALLLTFDDGYRNNLQYTYPLLKEFGWCATIFIIGDTITGERTHMNGPEEYNQVMNAEELKLMSPDVIQYGLHGFRHENFSETSVEELKKLTSFSIKAFEEKSIPYYKVLAYPYGARPKDAAAFNDLKKWMKEEGVEAAFRIGGKVAKMPVDNVYEIKRIDIRGTDSVEDFKIKLVKGKLKPF